MRSRWDRSHLLLLVVASLLCATSAGAQEAAQKYPLSEKIQLLIDDEGTEAAERWYREVYPGEKDGYDADLEAFATLARDYVEAGDYEAGTLVMQVMTTVARDGASAQVPAAAQMPAPPPAPGSGGEPPVPAAAPAAAPSGSPAARKDLGRFHGLYGEPGQEDPVRGLIFTESCTGFLVVTTTWGDSSPWMMNSVSDTEFEYTDSWISFRAEFDLADGSAESVAHDMEYLPSPLPRLGPLPEGWEKCFPDRRG